MSGIKLTIVLKQKFPVGAMAHFTPPAGAHASITSSTVISISCECLSQPILQISKNFSLFLIFWRDSGGVQYPWTPPPVNTPLVLSAFRSEP
jgi:hypothetical protein